LLWTVIDTPLGAFVESFCRLVGGSLGRQVVLKNVAPRSPRVRHPDINSELRERLGRLSSFLKSRDVTKKGEKGMWFILTGEASSRPGKGPCGAEGVLIWRAVGPMNRSVKLKGGGVVEALNRAVGRGGNGFRHRGESHGVGRGAGKGEGVCAGIAVGHCWSDQPTEEVSLKVT